MKKYSIITVIHGDENNDELSYKFDVNLTEESHKDLIIEMQNRIKRGELDDYSVMEV